MHRLYLSIISVLLAAVVYLALKQGIGGHQSIAADQGARSIAVLQFVPLGEEPDTNALAGALTEELIDALVVTEGIRVAARTDSVAVKHVSPAAARALGVQYLLEGSVGHEADTIRVTAQLVDGETEAHLWSETYERSGANVSEFSADIARSVIDRLKSGEQ